MRTKFNLNEDAENFISKNGSYVVVTDWDAVPFMWNNEKPSQIMIGETGTYHSHNEELEDFAWQHDVSNGRLWTDRKVMGFWAKPETPEAFTQIILSLEDELGISIFQNDWFYHSSEDELLPVDEYDPDKVEIDEDKLSLHLLSPEEKSKKLKELGYKPKKVKTPKGMSQAQYRNKSTKFQYTENMKHIKSFKLYESPDSVSKDILGDITDYRLSWSDDDMISFGYYEGEMVTSYGGIHEDAIERYTGDWGFGRKDMTFAGRLWVEEQVISFWEYPDDYKELIDCLEDIEEKEDCLAGTDWDEWNIEVIMSGDEQIINKYKYWGDSEIDGDQRYIDDSVIIKVADYKGSGKRSKEELETPHLMSPEEKEAFWKNHGKPRGMGSDKQWDKVKGAKSLTSDREMTPAQWNYHKKQESAQFTYNKQLNPKFWHDSLFDERLREKLMTIANEFYDGLGYESPIEDVTLTGSLANFNYNEYSDLDVHVMIDFKKINSNEELVKKAVDGYRFMWNLRHNIRIKGHDVELYIQDINEPHTASGLYSLKDAKWLTTPTYTEPTIDEEEVNFKFLTYKSGIEMLEDISQKEMTPEVAHKNYLFASNYKRKIHQARKDDLSTGGEFSVGNLVFKKLRNSGDFKKLIDIIGVFYDKIYSQK